MQIKNKLLNYRTNLTYFNLIFLGTVTKTWQGKLWDLTAIEMLAEGACCGSSQLLFLKTTTGLDKNP